MPAYAKQSKLESVKLAFCSQLLCVVPYEITRAAGFFADEGLDVQLVYSRGGSAALQALHGGGVDYAATSFDAALGAYANGRSEEHTSELQSRGHLVCRLLLEKKKQLE